MSSGITSDFLFESTDSVSNGINIHLNIVLTDNPYWKNDVKSLMMICRLSLDDCLLQLMANRCDGGVWVSHVDVSCINFMRSSQENFSKFKLDNLPGLTGGLLGLTGS